MCRKDACLRAGSVSAERVEQEEVGGVTRRGICTWWLLWLSVEMPWLTLGSLILALFAQIGLENPTLTFSSGSKGCIGCEWVFAGQEC